MLGRPAFVPLDILDGESRVWRLRPNRKLMPSRWIVTDPDGSVALQFDQRIAGKLANPLYRCALAALDAQDRELWRVIDPRSSVLDRALGTGPNDWAIVREEQVLGRLARLPRERSPGRGWSKVLRAVFAGSDPGIVSVGTDHLLAPPVGLALLVLVEVLTDAS